MPLTGQAETVVRTGDAISVEKEQAVAGDYYVSVGLLGQTSMSGKVAGDMYALGGSVTVNGDIDQDLTLLSAVSQIHAKVKDDVRILSGEVLVADDIGGDLYVIAGSLKVLSSAHVKGNIYFFGGEGLIEGVVDGSVYGTNSRLRIDGPIAGSIDVKTNNQLTLGSRASIGGDISYVSDRDLIRAQESVVEGRIGDRSARDVENKASLKFVVLKFLIVLFASLTLYLLFRRKLADLFVLEQEHYVITALIGIAVIVLAPLASFVLLVSVLGSLLGLILGGLTIMLLVVGYVISGILAGSYMAKFFTGRHKLTLTWLLIGTAMLQILSLVPVFGWLVVVLVIAYSVGLLTIKLYQLLTS